MKTKLTLLLFLITGICSVYAQQVRCGADIMKEKQINTDPLFRQKEETMNRLIYEKTIHSQNEDRNRLPVRTIPLVVHIMHQGGPENISDSLVIAAVDQLNLRFQNAAPYYDSTGHAVNIQFCLASIDPQGHPTTGITRDSTPLTALYVGNDVQMKNLNRWDPLYYYNVWTVAAIFGFNIGGVIGYSSLPPNIGDNTDGVVLDYFALNSESFAHETGHYLGLYHTFAYGNCINFNCLLDGDFVCDTPPDSTSDNICPMNSCNTEMNDTSGFNPFTGDVSDAPNYMDYTSCPLSFTQGQADRMNNTLTVVRYLLLQSSGCGFTGSTPPVAHLHYTISNCNNGVVTFSDSLSTNINIVSWDFDNNGVFDSHLHNPNYTYTSTGTYTVKLLVMGPGGLDSIMQTIFVQASPSQYYPITYIYAYSDFHGGFKICNNAVGYYMSAPAVSYLWSTGDTTQTISFTSTSNYTLTLTIVDSAGLTWTNQVCNPINVSVYPPPPPPVIYTRDSLTICNDTIHFHTNTGGNHNNYFYQWFRDNGNIVNSLNDSTLSVTTGIVYQLITVDTNFCSNYSNTIYVNSLAVPQFLLTQNNLHLSSEWPEGNQWYLNGVVIPGATDTAYDVTQSGCYTDAYFYYASPQCTTMSDSICFTTVGQNEISDDNSIIISPNPFTSQTIITSTKNLVSNIKIMDVLGNIIRSWELGVRSKEVIIEKGELSNGIYFVQITDENKNIVNRKIVVQ